MIMGTESKNNKGENFISETEKKKGKKNTLQSVLQFFVNHKITMCKSAGQNKLYVMGYLKSS